MRPPSSSTDADKNSDKKAADKAFFRPLMLLAVTVFIDLLGFGIILPNLPQYVKMAAGTDNGYAATVASWLAASYSLTQFLCAPFWGRLSDIKGRRPVILISQVGFAAACALFGLAGTHLWILFAARLLGGLLSSASIGVAFAYVADVTTPENRARGMGILGACFGMGFILGPVVGGLLGHFVNIAAPAFAAALLSLANFAFSIKMLPESLSKEERARRAHSDQPSLFRMLPKVIFGPAGLLYILSFVMTFGFAAMEQMFGYFLLAQGIANDKNQPLVMAMILGLVGIISAIIQGGLIGPLVKKFGEATIARTGAFLMTIAFATIPLAHTPAQMAFGPSILLAMGRALLGAPISSLISRKANLGQGLTLSVSQSFEALARTMGPLVAGYLFYKIAPAAPYYFSAVLLFAVFLLTFIYRKNLEMKSESTGGANETAR
jgi:multidrug resistance protein